MIRVKPACHVVVTCEISNVSDPKIKRSGVLFPIAGVASAVLLAKCRTMGEKSATMEVP